MAISRPNFVHTPNSITTQFLFLCHLSEILENRKRNSVEYYMTEHMSNN